MTHPSDERLDLEAAKDAHVDETMIAYNEGKIGFASAIRKAINFGAGLRKEPKGLVWTKESPEQEGWYWMRYVNGAGCIVDVSRYHDSCALDRGWGYDAIEENMEWAGPIPSPSTEEAP